MPKTIFADTVGPPEVMKLVEHDPGMPGRGEIRMRQSAMGVNFGDIHKRRGTAPPHAMAQVKFPLTPGLEAAGIVEAVGPEVPDLRRGDRVAYAVASMVGGYAESRLIDAQLAVKLPDDVTDHDVAAVLYKGITVHGMIRSCHKVEQGQTILLHAAAGGVGSVLARWASGLGARVIGTVSTRQKAERALANGCSDVIVLNEEDFVSRTRELTDGRGVDVVYDGVGEAVFRRSLEAIRKYGMMVSFGHTSGMVSPLDPVELQHNGIYLTRFSGSTYNARIEDYRFRAGEVIKAISAGLLSGANPTTYPLRESARAHRDIEERRTQGPVVLLA